jgi:hypothetical protein
MKKSLLVFIAGMFVCFANEHSRAQTSPSPDYVSLIPNLNGYYLYANDGWDANWFVGYNSCWTVKLPPIPNKKYVKAYIGAKLGRAKAISNPEKIWEKIPIEGKVYMGLAQIPSFLTQDTFFLTEASDIPLESLDNEPLKGAGESQWFWTEVPLSKLSAKKPNYISIWSSSPNFKSNTTSPIIAGGELKDSNSTNVWISKSLDGVPPRNSTQAMETPVKNLTPAIAIKLVPANKLSAHIKNFDYKIFTSCILFSFNVYGQDIHCAWLEISYEGFHWQKISGLYFKPPYLISLDKSDLPSQDPFYIRAAAVDYLGNVGYSDKKHFILSSQK